jgi:hypothetical protein
MAVRTSAVVQNARDFSCTTASTNWIQQCTDTTQLAVNSIFEVTVPNSGIMIGLKNTATAGPSALQSDSVAMMFSAGVGQAYGTGFNNGNIAASSVSCEANDVMMLKREATKIVASVRRSDNTVVLVSNIAVTPVVAFPAIAFNNVGLLARNPTIGV